MDQGRVRFSFHGRAITASGGEVTGGEGRYNVSFSEGVVSFQGGLDAKSEG